MFRAPVDTEVQRYRYQAISAVLLTPLLMPVQSLLLLLASRTQWVGFVHIAGL